MAVRKILEIPHPILRQRAKKVRNIDSDVLRLAYDMVETMDAFSGVGLAANQVGDLRRLIAIHLPDEDEARIYINPEITQREGEREVEEGCLSLPGYKGLINRSVTIKFRALNHESKTVKLNADELLAQALEHEVDHLNGILYVDHLESHERLYKIEPDEDDPQVEDTSNIALPTDEQVDKFGDADNNLSSGGSDTPASLKIR